MKIAYEVGDFVFKLPWYGCESYEVVEVFLDEVAIKANFPGGEVSRVSVDNIEVTPGTLKDADVIAIL